ncbi:MAG: class I tRNA ligase family protein [Ferruginibacter sp.]|nr:class I tRNA ligase family protein [Ferruginibacter sp.]
MPAFKHLKEGKRKYLLIPVMPTPNGGLHLGHLSGPYLKMDVLARAQRRNGSEAAMFFGSDGYESYMNLKSWQTGKEVTTLCNEYHERMRSDLDALNIAYDAFINPLDTAYHEDFKTFFTTVTGELVDKGVTAPRPEKYLYSKEDDCFVAGCWILGNCPVCGSATGSYQCEDCGTQYRPMDLISPTFRKGDHPLSSIDDRELYLVISKKEELLKHLETMKIGAEFMEIATSYFNHQGRYVRITNPGKWGIPWSMENSGIPHVLFTYTSLYFYSLYCGELYKKKYNAAVNPFDIDADVITVASFGIDCTIPYLVAGVGLALESGTYRPIDFLLPNHFFTLENSKFSTSRGHAIWGNDIINKTPVSSDAIRYFLVWKNPENEMGDFNVEEFIHFVNDELGDQLQSVLTRAWTALNGQPVGSISEGLAEKLEGLLVEQNDYLTPPGFQLKNSSLPLKEWISIGSGLSFDADPAYWWLKGFSLLAFPIMPGCAISLWNLLGHKGNPVEKDYFLPTPVQVETMLPLYFKKISFEDIKPALPATLFTNEYK